ncbi:TonB-dependent receptor [Thalassobaculum fulvum]|jgi:iron complex outermembrane receptor protein|uniref:TonB-dependent receptor n=1 Tax=Thalassobaculum fulvum TaxID=1633335 RepID=A0A918XWX2_9PROT|nr:TonB-dependent receptor [Thalassobaculum fulvum]GHD60147.1 TonB-dependent receptor [Thalassobaculum fulvum]
MYRPVRPLCQATLATVLLIGFRCELWAAEPANPITQMSLEYLMNVEVTTVSKQPERAQNAAAAVYVLPREEIQRSGATSLPDALRLVPGVNVARINASSWAVSIRGFNSRFANKLLVMIDGRSVYSPLFSGVFWDRNNVPIDDIDRIEVVRGPGGTLWGANAVNGIINIITRHSAETQGARAEISAGTAELGRLSLRQGGVLGNNGSYRLSVQSEAHDATTLSGSTDGNDGWDRSQVDLRLDWTPTARDVLLLEAGANSVSAGDRRLMPSLTAPYSGLETGDTDRYGTYVLGRWDRELGATSNMSVQGYIDHQYMDIDTPIAEESRTTADLHAQHRFVVGSGIQVTWGGGYRLVREAVETPSFSFEVEPGSESIEILDGFVQASRRFFENRVEVTLGTKVEHQSITGTEVQPSARVLWNVTPDHTVWSSVSQAVRTPSMVESNGAIRNVVIPPGTAANPSQLPLVVSIDGSRALDAERITAYEVGYRARLSAALSIDVAGFYNTYDGLLLDVTSGTATVNGDYGTPFLDAPAAINENADGRTYGLEVAATWQAAPNWRVRGGYSWLREDLDAPEGAEGNAPKHQATIRSYYDIAPEWRFDTVVRFVDELTNLDADGYVDVDARLSWSPSRSVELALTGKNLLSDGRREFGTERAENPSPLATEVERSLLATLVIKF